MTISSERHERAVLALCGLSVGDAFGARCFAGEHDALEYPGDERVLLEPAGRNLATSAAGRPTLR